MTTTTTETPKHITCDCWNIQMFGDIEKCATCEYYPFNLKSGKLLKSSQCGGGQTLALKIYKKFNDSIYSAMKAREFFNNNPEACFTEFVENAQKEGYMRYSLKKYKRFINNLKQIAKEQAEHEDVKRLDQLYPYEEIRQKARLTQKESYHYVPNNICDCQLNTTRKGAYRIETYELNDLVLYYLHQHCVVCLDRAKQTITLDSCEWRTLTTKARINEALRRFGLSLYSERYIWKVTKRHWDNNKHEWITEFTKDFYDGITLKVA